MNSEERKNYNKTYYTTNKDKILNCLSKKETCRYCERIVAKSRLQSHQHTQICLNNRTDYILKSEIENEIHKRVLEILDKKDEQYEPEPIIEIKPVCLKSDCMCGSKFLIKNNGEYYHKKTKKHIEFLENLNI
jgi:hypothetical protein